MKTYYYLYYFSLAIIALVVILVIRDFIYDEVFSMSLTYFVIIIVGGVASLNMYRLYRDHRCIFYVSPACQGFDYRTLSEAVEESVKEVLKSRNFPYWIKKPQMSGRIRFEVWVDKKYCSFGGEFQEAVAKKLSV